jgi:tripartite-type tricarboxylate transporter receptor subunit TctC
MGIARICALVAAILATVVPGATCAQSFPDHPIKIITPTTAGGPLDVMSRLIGQGFQAKWGQGIVLEPRPGGAQNIAAELFYRAPPDGYTLMLAAPTPYAINQHLFAKLAYEPSAFTPITILVVASNYLIVPADSPAKTLQDLIDHARKNPGKLNYASVGLGSTQHLTGEAFKAAGNLDIVHVPYKGSSEVMVDVLGGRVDLTFMNVVDAMPHIESGKLRALGVGAPQRSPRFPDMPAIAEVFPGFQSQV